MLGDLYFIQEGSEGCIKIGWTRADPEVRLRTFQVGNSSTLRLLGSVLAPLDAETGWHERFAGSCRRSEWFWPTPDLLAAIEEAVAQQEMVLPTAQEFVGAVEAAGATEVLAWMKARDIDILGMAKLLGYTPAHVANSLDASRSWGVSPRMAYRIEKVTEGEIQAEALLVVRRERELARLEQAEAANAEHQRSLDQWIADGMPLIPEDER